LALTKKFVLRKEPSNVTLYPWLLPVEASIWKFYIIRANGKKENGDKAGALEDYKKAAELIHHNLLANPFGLLNRFATLKKLKDSIKKMEE
jgi:hypothetical protein